MGGKHAYRREASHRGHGGHRGGILVGWRVGSLVDSVTFGRETPAWREHRTQVTEVTEGDFGGNGASGLWGTSSLLGGKHTLRGEHRTEVREGILLSRRRSSPSTASRKIGNYSCR
jgi:hypothetical protein